MADNGDGDGNENEKAEKWDYDKSLMVLDYGDTASNDGCQLGSADSLDWRDRVWGWMEANSIDSCWGFDESETTYQRPVDLLSTRRHALFSLFVSGEAPPYEENGK